MFEVSSSTGTDPARAADPNGRCRLVDASAWPPAEWDALAVASPHGDVMQSRAWGEHKAENGWESRRFIVESGAGERLAAVSVQERPLLSALPGRVLRLVPGPFRRAFGRVRYVYAPRGPVLLRDDEESVAAVVASLRLLARRRVAIALTVDPAWIDGGPEETALERGGFGVSARPIQVSRTAMIVPLFEDEHEQHALVAKSAAHSINRARREGVTVERVDLSDAAGCESDLREFYDVLADTGRRRGFIVRDRDYQLSQWLRLGAAGLLALWWARHDGRRVAGGLVLQAGDRLTYHQAGSVADADLGRTRANHLLQWEIMRWGAANGYRTYDLGGVDTHDAPGVPADASHPLWNLYVFKSNLGAKAVLYGPAREYSPNGLFRLAWRLARRFVG